MLGTACAQAWLDLAELPAPLNNIEKIMTSAPLFIARD